MTKLERLLYRLTACIVRYHDMQKTISIKLTTPDRACAFAIELINDEDYKTRLQEIKDRATKGYEHRRHYLHYLISHIVHLKTLRDNPAVFTEKRLEAHKAQFNQLFLDFRLLLETYQNTACSVHTSNNEKITLTSGLKSNAVILGGKYCLSGDLLIEEVLAEFQLQPESPVEAFQQIAEHLCDEQHIVQLRTERNVLTDKNALLEKELAHLKSTYMALPPVRFGFFPQKKDVETIHQQIIASSSNSGNN